MGSHSVRSSSTLNPLSAMNPFAVGHTINLLALALFLLPVFCPHLAASFHSLLPVPQPHSLILLLASLSFVLLCFSYILVVVTQRTGVDCTDLNFEQFLALACRLLGLFSTLFLKETSHYEGD